jgi:V/A-type H+-transporting ATPase subunit B
MYKWHKTATELVGPLLVVDGIEGAMFDDLVEIKTAKGDRKMGKVLEARKNSAVVQVFGATEGMDLENTKVRFFGTPYKFGVSESMLGRIFTGFGDVNDGGVPVVEEKSVDINGAPINPFMREYPDDFVQTGISSIDVMNTVVQGQKIPIFSIAGLPHAELAAQIVKQVKIKREGEIDPDFAIVFGAIGITFEESQYFINEFTKYGALSRTVMFLNLASDPVIERIVLPRLVLSTAEYLAYEKGKNILVVMTDITNYCNALREVSAARKEIPGRRSYPGYMYTDLASLYERAGRVNGSKGSITQLPILTMPEGDKTHPIPDLTGYITEGQIVMSAELHRRSISPPIDVLPSLSRLMSKAIGEGKTRKDHSGVANQLFAAYARGKEVKGLMKILGESSLSEADKKFVKFVDAFENEFINQGFKTDRDIIDSLELGWKLLAILPESELKKVKPEDIEQYMRKYTK